MIDSCSAHQYCIGQWLCVCIEGVKFKRTEHTCLHVMWKFWHLNCCFSIKYIQKRSIPGIFLASLYPFSHWMVLEMPKNALMNSWDIKNIYASKKNPAMQICVQEQTNINRKRQASCLTTLHTSRETYKPSLKIQMFFVCLQSFDHHQIFRGPFKFLKRQILRNPGGDWHKPRYHKLDTHNLYEAIRMDPSTSWILVKKDWFSWFFCFFVADADTKKEEKTK